MPDLRLVTASIKENISYVESTLPVEESFDILKREIKIGGREAVFYFVQFILPQVVWFIFIVMS